MDFFRSGVLKKEYENFVKEILPLVAECGLCVSCEFSCEYDKKFLVTCCRCREQRCTNCFSFKTLFDILTKNGNDEAKDYLTNFTYDYLGIRELSAEFFNIRKSEERIEKVKFILLRTIGRVKKVETK